MRLSVIAKDKFNLSRRSAKEAISERKFIVNGKTATKDIDISDTDTVEYLGEVAEVNFAIDDYILERSNDIIFLYKPPFMHSDRLKPSDSLTMSDIVNSFTDYRSLSRLDYETDGIIALVKKEYKVQRVKKEYLAVVKGEFPEEFSTSWSIDADNRQKVKVNNDYNGHLTYMKCIDRNGTFNLINVSLDMASRHQIRAYCERLNCPIVGDKLYGGIEYRRLMLHCRSYTVNDVTVTSQKYGDEFIDEFRKIK